MPRKSLLINSEQVYLFAFGIYYWTKFYESTMFIHTFSTGVLTACRVFALALLALKVFLSRKTEKNRFIMLVAVMALSVAVYFFSSYKSLVEIIIFIITGEGVHFKKLLKVTLVVGISWAFVSFFASQLGIIDDLVYHRQNGKIRHAFGSIYPTNFAAHIYFFVLSVFYLKDGKLKAIDFVIDCLIVGLLDIFCNTRLTEITIILLLLYAIRYKGILKRKKVSLPEKIIAVISIPVCAAVSFAMCAFYDSSVSWMRNLNTLLSRRLQYGQYYLKNYAYSLFGSFIEQHGDGGTTQKLSERGIGTYTYIDISYMRILFMFGFFALLIVCLAYAIYCFKRVKKGDYLIPICITLIAISSMFDQHLIDFSYNPFIFGFLTIVPENSILITDSD